MEIRSFSGAHPWHPTVLLDTDAHDEGNAEEIIEKHRVGAMPAMRRAAAYAARVPSGKPNDPVPVHPHLRPLRRRRGLQTVGRRNLESRVLAATRGRDR